MAELLCYAGQLESLTGAHSIGLAYKPAETGAASELAQTIGLVGSESSLDLARLPLDHTGLPGCGDACVEESLKARPLTLHQVWVGWHTLWLSATTDVICQLSSS